MIRNTLRQKGAILVLTALALPMLICATGLAVDLGNIYVQRSRLQNAADAAAIAGAHAYADNAEKVSSHPKADAMAGQYLTGSAKNLEEDEVVHPNYQAKSKDNITYYRVALQKDVPLYFLKAFYGKDTFTVPVESIAAINTTAPKGLFQHLFIFKKNLSVVNSIENPDRTDKQGQIKTSFDGSVIYTNGTGKEVSNYKYNNLQYSTQRNSLNSFFTQRAINENLSIDQALQKTKAAYDDTTGKTITDGYSHSAYYLPYDLTILGTSIKAMTKDTQTNQSLSTSDIKDSTNKVLYFDNNASINVNSAIAGSIDAPVYIDAGKNASVVNIDLKTDTRRPLIIYTEGTTQIHMNLNGHTFRGIIYAPDINDEGVLINAGGGTFSGTIAAASINLQGGAGHYKYENFLGNDDGGSGGGSTSGATTVTLTNNPSGITWND